MSVSRAETVVREPIPSRIRVESHNVGILPPAHIIAIIAVKTKKVYQTNCVRARLYGFVALVLLSLRRSYFT
jgi:hypothetical protein